MKPPIPNLSYLSLLHQVFDDIRDLPVTFFGLDTVENTMKALRRPLNPTESRTWQVILQNMERQGTEVQQQALARLYLEYQRLVKPRGPTRMRADSSANNDTIKIETSYGYIEARRPRIPEIIIDLKETEDVEEIPDHSLFAYKGRVWAITSPFRPDVFEATLFLRLLLEKLGFYQQQVTVYDQIRFKDQHAPEIMRKHFLGFSVEPLDGNVWEPAFVSNRNTNDAPERWAPNLRISPEIARRALKNVFTMAYAFKKMGMVLNRWRDIKINRLTGEVSMDVTHRPLGVIIPEYLHSVFRTLETFKIQTLEPETLDAQALKPEAHYFPNLLSYYFGYTSDQKEAALIIESEQQLADLVDHLIDKGNRRRPSPYMMAADATVEFLVLLSRLNESDLIRAAKDNKDTLREIIFYYNRKLGEVGLPAFLCLALPNIMRQLPPEEWRIWAGRYIDQAPKESEAKTVKYWREDFDPLCGKGKVLKFGRNGGGQDGGSTPPAVPEGGVGPAPGSTPGMRPAGLHESAISGFYHAAGLDSETSLAWHTAGTPIPRYWDSAISGPLNPIYGVAISAPMFNTVPNIMLWGGAGAVNAPLVGGPPVLH